MTARSRGSGRRLDLGDDDVVELLEEGDAFCGDFVEAACRGPAGVRGSLRVVGGCDYAADFVFGRDREGHRAILLRRRRTHGPKMWTGSFPPTFPLQMRYSLAILRAPWQRLST